MTENDRKSEKPEELKEQAPPPWLRVPGSLLDKFAVPEPDPEDTVTEEEGELFPLPGDKPKKEPRKPVKAETVETGEWGWPVRIPVRERALAILLGTVATLVVVVTPTGYGLSWDEAYYYQPSLDAAGWLASAVRLEKGWSDAQATEEGFGRVWELPPVVKVMNGTAWAVAAPMAGNLRALRLPSAFTFGLTVSLIYGLGWLGWRRAGAMAAVVVYATMPRVFGHAHLAATETVTAFMMLLVVYAFLRGLQVWSWAIVCAIFFALALVTKINAVFLPLVLLPWAWVHARKASVANLYAWIFLTPPLVFLMWPWLWHDTVYHLLQYFDFAASHPKLGLWFQGQKWNYNAPAAPWYYPAQITLATLPPLTAIAILAGVLLSILRWKRTNRIGRLALWASLVLIGLSSLPSTPKYDGIRLFFPAMPFLSLLAGSFVTRMARLGTRLRFHEFLGMTGRQIIVVAVTMAIGIGGIVAISLSHPHELSYYNIFVGGTEGAERRGFEITYWGEALGGEVVSELNRLLPPNARLKTFALHDLSLRILQQWGRLRGDIRIEGPPPYDAYLLQNRKGFWGRAEQSLYEEGTPVAVWDYDGVPLLLLYLERGASRPTARPKPAS